ncbi:MAG TPA: response regulator [Chthoniobacterales bacterium]
MKNDVRILAVEDETAVAQLLALVLCGPSCKVVTACDGSEALAKVAKSPELFDVVITDHQMPKVNGLQLVRALRERDFGGKIAVLSAHLNELNTRAYEELNVDLMLTKPFDIDELRHAVEVLSNSVPEYAGRVEHETRQGLG